MEVIRAGFRSRSAQWIVKNCTTSRREKLRAPATRTTRAAPAACLRCCGAVRGNHGQKKLRPSQGRGSPKDMSNLHTLRVRLFDPPPWYNKKKLRTRVAVRLLQEARER